MIWELHKDGCEYLFEGHDCLGSVDIRVKESHHKGYLGWFDNWTEAEEFKTKLEAKAWVESKVKKSVAHEN